RAPRRRGRRRARVVRRPPMAGGPVHLLLRDEFGAAPADRAAAVGGEPALGPARGLGDVEILVTNEGEIAAGPRDLGIQLGLGRAGQAADIAVEPGDIE